MAFGHGKNAKVVIGTENMTTFLNEASRSSEVETGETTTFGKNRKTYVVGLVDGTVSLSGLWRHRGN